MAIACICHSNQGSTLWARPEIFRRMSPFKVELLAIQMAVGEAQAQGLEQVIFECDSLPSVDGIRDPTL